MVKECSLDTNERSLYECFHAKVKGKRIYCAKGHPLQDKGERNGSVNIERLARGEPLIMSICQDCADFENMGGPLFSEECGWLRVGSNPNLDKERIEWQKSLAR